jgi:hypothetical protein
VLALKLRSLLIRNIYLNGWVIRNESPIHQPITQEQIQLARGHFHHWLKGTAVDRDTTSTLAKLFKTEPRVLTGVNKLHAFTESNRRG